MANPTIEELQTSGNFELIAELNHREIKEFVIKQLAKDGTIIRFFMVYQVLMIITGIFFFTRSIVLAFHSQHNPLIYSLAALVFCFSFLIIIHELLHGVALKITGAKKLHFGGYLKKFIFYAEADQHVLNRQQFVLVALAPLVTVKLITLIGIILFLHHPVFYFLIVVMSAHSLFCAGDIGLLSLFYHEKDEEIFTYDVREEKKSYFYKRITGGGLS